MSSSTDSAVGLKKSKYLQTRADLLRHKMAPKLSNAKTNLGGALAQLLFESCEDALKEDFGLARPLRGPGDNLWVSPSDLLIGKLALKPPFTPKCLQALTHRGILQIGKELEDRTAHQAEMEKEKALEKYRDELLKTMEETLKSTIKDVEVRERLNCSMLMERQNQEFEIKLRAELESLQKKLDQQHIKTSKHREEDLKIDFNRRLEREIESTVRHLAKVFIAQLDEQEKRLVHRFQLEVTEKETLRQCDLKNQEKKTVQALKLLRHKLECTNLVNMMYVLCSEREKCCKQKREIEDFYRREGEELRNLLVSKDERIAKLAKAKAQKSREVEVRDASLLEILKQFQKFINFALKSAPKQSEFLLSVEKMVNFSSFKDIGETRACKSSDDDLRLSKPKSSNAHSVNQDHQFKTYVRENFENLPFTCPGIRPSNDLWNQDVEVLLENLRWMVSDDQLSEKRSNDDHITQYPRQRRSTVHFGSSDEQTAEDRPPKEMKRRSSLKPSTKFEVVREEYEHVIQRPVRVAKILAARDSLELLKERLVAAKEEGEDEADGQLKTLKNSELGERESSRNLAVEARDSIILRKASLVKRTGSTEFRVTPKDSIEVRKDNLNRNNLDRRSSKLVTARDSVEMIRESLAKLKVPSPICRKKDQSVQSFQTTTSCCHRCRKLEEAFSITHSDIEREIKASRGSLDERSVKVSHIEVIDRDPSITAQSVVSFHPKLEVFEEKPVGNKEDPLPKEVKKRSTHATKTEVVGDEECRAGQQSAEEFTEDRIRSLIDIMKQHPHLMAMFTACRR
ncbi:cilia- and flagella-associated protein 45-like [Cylas formicarius]|uniref:cilia- and flagella-associated protein 45-like n=1 Tax=Cylas formicarius TaxID=197179 RepID=UPI0029588475|nr:cilia- and flagella-associated protein 45-like [Cylas formicarius]